MPLLVVSNAPLMCSFGAAPSTLTVAPASNKTDGGNQPAATIMDNVPNKNIAPFGMCSSLSNPQVASATSAAAGVLTPQPCQPVIPAPWSPGASMTTVNGMPALHDGCTCNCAWGGVIKINAAGQTAVQVS